MKLNFTSDIYQGVGLRLQSFLDKHEKKTAMIRMTFTVPKDDNTLFFEMTPQDFFTIKETIDRFAINITKRINAEKQENEKRRR